MNSQVSFRDPGGQVLVSNDRVFRKINRAGRKDIEAFLTSPAARQCIGDGRIIGSRIIDSTQIASIVPEAFISGAEFLFEHDKVFFPSYPAEWSPEMLHAAAYLTIELAEMFVKEGMGLKDATPYNILFQGPRPIFLDILSIERRDPKDPIWIPNAQFERTFILPLLANHHFKITLDQIFLSSREGIEPERIYALCSRIKRLIPPFFSFVTLPVWLGERRKVCGEAIYAAKRHNDPEKVRFIIEHILKRLRQFLNNNSPTNTSRTSVWSGYETDNTYSSADYAIKSAFIEGLMRDYTPRAVLDIGCNTGHFSQIAARNGAKVVAIDVDPVVVGRLWGVAHREHLDILPLVVNLAHPTPACGWRNKETLSFLFRATHKFDAVFMLAVVHHLLVTERIPLREILELAACLTTNLLAVEFIGPDDPMFRLLCRGRMDLYRGYTKKVFEDTAMAFFEIIQSVRLGEMQRWVYLLKKRDI